MWVISIAGERGGCCLWDAATPLAEGFTSRSVCLGSVPSPALLLSGAISFGCLSLDPQKRKYCKQLPSRISSCRGYLNAGAWLDDSMSVFLFCYVYVFNRKNILSLG